MKVNKELVYAAINQMFKEGLIPVTTTLNMSRDSYDKAERILIAVADKEAEMESKK